MNEADSRKVAAQLEALGYAPARHAEEASLVVLNTCVVRQQAEDRAVRRLHPLKALKRKKPGTVIALMGCMVSPRELPELKQRFPWVDVFAPPSDAAPLLDHVEAAHGKARRAERDAIQDGAPGLPASQQARAVTAFVPVVLGCSHGCTFCVIPGRRGRERSRPPDEILKEARRLAGQGVRELTLLGQIVDRYGLDLDGKPDLAGLLEEISAIPEVLRVRFLTSHPNWLTDRLLDAVATLPKVCPYFEVPFQSGNDEILARMKRGYTADDYRRLVGRIRDRIPDAAVLTDIIVGFPGETEAQFMDSYRLLDELRLDVAHIAQYSVRPGTVAARTMNDDVPPEEKQRRWQLLEDRQTEIQAEKNSALLGRTVEVLAEERAKNGRWRGRTPQNKLVFFEGKGDWLGRETRVTLDWTGPFTLIGHAHADGAGPAAGPGPATSGIRVPG